MEGIAAMPSKQLAGLIGPTLVALGATEALNIHIFENQIAAVIYLNGTILFVVGRWSARITAGHGDGQPSLPSPAGCCWQAASIA
jgi:hypothetical protein